MNNLAERVVFIQNGYRRILRELILTGDRMNLTYEEAIDFTRNISRPMGRESSVRYGENPIRIQKAREQAKLAPVPIALVADYVNEYLSSLGMEPTADPVFGFDTGMSDADIADKTDNALYAPLHNRTGDCRNLVWIKFTQDGFLGVVALSNDINFDIPKSADGHKCARNTSGIIVRTLGKEWDRNFVLAFPLVNIPADLRRGDIETGIGNYLIEREVPILDYYSHRY